MPLIYTAENDTATPLVTTAETVIATVNGITTQRNNQTVAIAFTGAISSGTGTTSVLLRCRRGTTTSGTQVGATLTFTATAGNAADYAAGWQDTPGDVANASYVVTAQQSAATANGSSNQVYTNVTVGNP